MRSCASQDSLARCWVDERAGGSRFRERSHEAPASCMICLGVPELTGARHRAPTTDPTPPPGRSRTAPTADHPPTGRSTQAVTLYYPKPQPCRGYCVVEPRLCFNTGIPGRLPFGCRGRIHPARHRAVQTPTVVEGNTLGASCHSGVGAGSHTGPPSCCSHAHIEPNHQRRNHSHQPLAGQIYLSPTHMGWWAWGIRRGRIHPARHRSITRPRWCHESRM